MTTQETKNLINFGSCAERRCVLMAERCEWNMCGICCRNLHSMAPRHTAALPLRPDNHFYLNATTLAVATRATASTAVPKSYTEKETEEPPQLGKLKLISAPEFPTEGNRIETLPYL